MARKRPGFWKEKRTQDILEAYVMGKLTLAQADEGLGGTASDKFSVANVIEYYARPIRKRLALKGSPPAQSTLSSPNTMVSTSLLADWRRQIVQLLNVLDQGSVRPRDESVAGRISRLSRIGAIPREIVPLMRTITEMRNLVEYELKTLSRAESAAVAAAYAAIQEWANTKGVKFPLQPR